MSCFEGVGAMTYGVCMEHKDIIPDLIVKWKNLEGLILGCISCVKDILQPVHIHLPSFSGLRFITNNVDGETASAIVSLVPKLKRLIINQAKLKREDLLLILQGCKELEYLDVRNCTGFDQDDEEILRLSSGIKNFQCDGSKAKDPLDFLTDQLNTFLDLDEGCDFEWDNYQGDW